MYLKFSKSAEWENGETPNAQGVLIFYKCTPWTQIRTEDKQTKSEVKKGPPWRQRTKEEYFEKICSFDDTIIRKATLKLFSLVLMKLLLMTLYKTTINVDVRILYKDKWKECLIFPTLFIMKMRNKGFYSFCSYYYIYSLCY